MYRVLVQTQKEAYHSAFHVACKRPKTGQVMGLGHAELSRNVLDKITDIKQLALELAGRQYT